MVEALHAVQARVGVGGAAIQRDTHAVPGSSTRSVAPQHARPADAVHTPIRARAARAGHASLPPSRVTALRDQASQTAQAGRTFPSASGRIRGFKDVPAESLTGNSQPNLAIGSTSMLPPSRVPLPCEHAAAPGEDCTDPEGVVQLKLAIGRTDDPLEHEADRVADRIMRMPDPSLRVGKAPLQIARKCAECEEEDKQEQLQMKPAAASPARTGQARGVLHDVLRSHGQPLGAAARAYFEPRFGQDFSDVRVHTDDRAADSAVSLGASAYTAGTDIVFATGLYDPLTTSGRLLLAHELTHVVQQRTADSSCASSEAALIQRDADSDDYKQGYQDGLSGADSQPGPRDGDALTDYSEGYAKGHYEFSQQASPASPPSPAPSTTPAPAPSEVPAAAPVPASAPAVADGGTPTPAPNAGPPADATAVDQVIAALQEPQENGVGNFPAACAVLNGMWMAVMLPSLEQLKQRGFFDLLHDNCPDMPRMQAALAAVAAKGTPATGQIASNPAFGSLPEPQQHEVATYLGLPWPIPQQATETAGGGGGGLTTGEVVAGVAAIALAVGAVVFFVAFPEAIPILAIVFSTAAGETTTGAAIAAAEPVTVALVTGGEAAATGTVVGAGETAAAAAVTQTTTAAVTTTAAETTAATTAAATSSATTTAAATTAGLAVASTTVSSDQPDQTNKPEEQKKEACSPTGLTPEDPIPMVWFKPLVDDYYPRTLRIQGHDYDRDSQDHLPHGEPIGVAQQYAPWYDKVFQLIPEERGDGADDFREVLLGYGFDWTGLQADHVQDLEWEGKDIFDNLWPMDSSANMSAGARTNQQVIGLCLTRTGPYVMYSLQEIKDAGLYGRYFQIRAISR